MPVIANTTIIFNFAAIGWIELLRTLWYRPDTSLPSFRCVKSSPANSPPVLSLLSILSSSQHVLA